MLRFMSIQRQRRDKLFCRGLAEPNHWRMYWNCLPPTKMGTSLVFCSGSLLDVEHNQSFVSCTCYAKLFLPIRRPLVICSQRTRFLHSRPSAQTTTQTTACFAPHRAKLLCAWAWHKKLWQDEFAKADGIKPACSMPSLGISWTFKKHLCLWVSFKKFNLNLRWADFPPFFACCKTLGWNFEDANCGYGLPIGQLNNSTTWS